MSEIFDWIKKHKIFTILIVASVFILPVFTLIYLNSVLAPSFFDEIGMSAESLITYIAGFETFIGTVFLGVVALRQNDKANEMSNLLLDIETRRNIIERQPRLSINAKKILLEPISKTISSGAIYSSDTICPLDERISDHWDEPYYYVSFNVKNLSSFDAWISLDMLRLDGSSTLVINEKGLAFSGDDIWSINYSTRPFPLKPYKTLIPTQQEVVIGFLLDPITSKKSRVKIGYFDLMVSNSLNDSYTFSQAFSIVHTKNDTYVTVLGKCDLSRNR